MAEADVKIKINVKDEASVKLKGIGNQMTRMSGTFRKAGTAMLGMSVALGAGLFALANKMATMGDEVAKMAKRTGFAVEALSELRHVAELSGTNLGSIEKSTKRMAKAISDASDGMATYIRAFDKLGISVADLKGMSPEEQFWKISTALAGVAHAGDRAAIAQDVFGKSGTELLPMLALGAEAIAELREEAHELGFVFTDESAVASEEFKDALLRLQTSLQGVAMELMDELLPSFVDFAEKTLEIIKNVKEWVAENDGLSKGLLVFAGVLAAGGALLVGLSMVSKAIKSMSSALVVLHALSGPAGWAKLAAGLAIAGGAIYGIKKIMGDNTDEAPDIPSLPPFKHGGIVPGPVGQPVPIMAHGGEAFAGVGNSLGNEVHIHIGSFMGDESSLRAFTRKVKEIMGQDTRRTSFSGINRLEYFPGSSAP